MTLQASGAISMSQICAEFSAPSNTALSGLYRGGAYVPNIGANAAIPTSGAIALSNFYNGTASAGVVTLSGGSWSGGGFLSGASGFIFAADGKVYTTGTDEGTAQVSASTDWIIPNGDGDGTYEILGSYVSGTASAMFGFLTADTWYTLDSDRTYGGGISFGGGPPFFVEATCTATIYIRKDGGSPLASANYTNQVYAYDI